MSSDHRQLIPDELFRKFLAGDRRACARLITITENTLDRKAEIRDLLIPHQKSAVRIGITGPPGAGKSTFTAALAKAARNDGKRVAVIAVDPSSPFTGGALLGDRIRMQQLVGDEGVFIRSLASRTGRGGISPATPYVADVFDAFGMDLILIETVGVGQAELDVLDCSDIVLLLLQPGAGDTIQAMKAGILEIGDMFIINKADLAGVDNLFESIRFIFEIAADNTSTPIPPIQKVSSIDGTGLQEAYSMLLDRIETFKKSGRIAEKRLRRLRWEIESSLRENLWRRFCALTDIENRLDSLAEKFALAGESPYPYIRELESKITMAASGGDGASHGTAHVKEDKS